MNRLPVAGDTINGRYRLLAMLGRGGMGTVWKARDLMAQREVALKHINMVDPELIRRREREIEAMRRVNHNNVVKLHEVVQVQGQPWIVMEYYHDAQTLRDLIGPQRVLPVMAELAWVACCLASGFEAMHRLQVIHRDVKPDNVLMLPDGRIIIIDLGIAKVRNAHTLTRHGAFLGSPIYAAPEQMYGDKATTKLDVYGLGATLYEFSEGEPAFDPNIPLGLLIKKILDGTVRPRKRPESDYIVTRMMHPDPDQRPTMTEVRQHFARSHGSSPAKLVRTRVMTHIDFSTKIQPDPWGSYAQQHQADERWPPRVRSKKLRGPRNRQRERRLKIGGALLAALLVLAPSPVGEVVWNQTPWGVSDVRKLADKDGAKYQLYKQNGQQYYRDDQIKVKVPKGWRVDKVGIFETSYRFAIFVRRNEPVRYLDEFFEGFTTRMGSVQTDMQVVKSSETMREWTFTGVGDVSGWTGRGRLFELKSGILLVAAVLTETGKREDIEGFEEMVESLEPA